MSQEKQVQVYTNNHPLKEQVKLIKVLPGLSISEILRETQKDPLLCIDVNVWINGTLIEKTEYNNTIVSLDDKVQIKHVLHGGDSGKQILTLVAMVALIVVAPYAAAALSGAAAGTTAYAVAYAGVMMVGTMAIQALIPPVAQPNQQGIDKAKTTYSLEGASNNIKRFATVRHVLGRHRVMPDYGANWYSEKVGDDTYLRLLFVWGYGPMSVSDIKIGETPIGEYNDVEIETRQGYLNDAPLTLYTNDVTQETVDANLPDTTTWISRTTPVDTDEITIETTLPRGLMTINTNTGSKSTATRSLFFEYRKSGDPSWLSMGVSGTDMK